MGQVHIPSEIPLRYLPRSKGANAFFAVLVIIGAVVLTLMFFLVLPWMQTLSKPPSTDLVYRSVDVAKLDEPEPPPEIEPEDSVRNMRVLDAMAAAARTGEATRVHSVT